MNRQNVVQIINAFEVSILSQDSKSPSKSRPPVTTVLPLRRKTLLNTPNNCLYVAIVSLL